MGDAEKDPNNDKTSTGSGNAIKSSSPSRISVDENFNTIDQVRKSSVIGNSRRESRNSKSNASASNPTPKSIRASGLSGSRRESRTSKPTTSDSNPPQQSIRASGLSDSGRESKNPKHNSSASDPPQQSVRGSGLSGGPRESRNSKLSPNTSASVPPQQPIRASSGSDSPRESRNSNHNTSISVPLQQSKRASSESESPREARNSKHITSFDIPRDSQNPIDNFRDNPNPVPIAGHSSSIKETTNPLSNESILVAVLSASHQGGSNECQNPGALAPPPPSQINNDIEDPHTSLARILFDETDIEPNGSAELIFSRGDEKPKSYLTIIESAANDLLQVIDKLNGAIKDADNSSLLSVKSQLNSLHTKLVDQSNNQKQKKNGTDSNVILNQKTRNINEFQEQRFIDGALRTFKKKDIHHVHEKIIGHNASSPHSYYTGLDKPFRSLPPSLEETCVIEPEIGTLSSAETVYRRNQCPEKPPGFGRTFIVDPAVNKSRNNQSSDSPTNQQYYVSQGPGNNKTQTSRSPNQINDNRNDFTCAITGYDPGRPPYQMCCTKCNQNNLSPCTTVHPNQACQLSSFNDKTFTIAGCGANNSTCQSTLKNQTCPVATSRNDKTFIIPNCGPNNATLPNQTCQASLNRNDKTFTIPDCGPNNSTFQSTLPNQTCQASSNQNDKTFTIPVCGPNNSTFQSNLPNQTCAVSSCRNDKTFTIPDNYPNYSTFQSTLPNQTCQASLCRNDKSFTIPDSCPNNSTFQSTLPNQTCQASSSRNDNTFCGSKNATFQSASPNQTYQASSCRNDNTFTLPKCGPNNVTFQSTLPNQTYQVSPSQNEKTFTMSDGGPTNSTFGPMYNVDPSSTRFGNGQSAYIPSNRTFNIDERQVSGPSPYQSQEGPMNSIQTNEVSYSEFSDPLINTPSSPHTPSLNSTMQQQLTGEQANLGINNATFTAPFQFEGTFEDYYQIADVTPPEFSTFYNTLPPDVNNATFNVSDSATMSRSNVERNFYQTQAVYNLIQEAFRTEPFNIWVVQNFFNMINGLKGPLRWNDILLCIADNIGEFTAVKVFNRLSFSELGHFNLSKSDMEEIYKCGLLDLFQYVRNRNLERDPLALDKFTPSVARMIQADMEEPGKQNCSKFLIFVKVFIKFSYYIMRKIEYRKLFWKFFVGPSFDEPAMELLYNVQTNLKLK